MSHATLEVADIIHTAGDSYWQKHGSHYAWSHRKALDAIARCRTAALGGHRDQCAGCGYQAISYNSCLMGSLSFWGLRAMKSAHSNV